MTGAHDTLLTLRDDNIQGLDPRWDEVLLSMSKNPSNEFLESLYKLRTRESDQLKTISELYDMENHQKTAVPKYQKLETMVKRSLDQKLRLRNFDAGHGRIESPKRIGRESLVLKEEKVFVASGKKKASVRKETNAVSGMRVTIVHKNLTTMQPHNAATPSEPSLSRGPTVSRKRNIRGKSNHGAILRPPCIDVI